MKRKDNGAIKKISGGQGLSTSSLKMSPRYPLAKTFVRNTADYCHASP